MATDSFSRTPSLPVRFARSDLIHVVHVWQCVCVCVCVCLCVLVCACVLLAHAWVFLCVHASVHIHMALIPSEVNEVELGRDELKARSTTRRRQLLLHCDGEDGVRPARVLVHQRACARTRGDVSVIPARACARTHAQTYKHPSARLTDTRAQTPPHNTIPPPHTHTHTHTHQPRYVRRCQHPTNAASQQTSSRQAPWPLPRQYVRPNAPGSPASCPPRGPAGRGSPRCRSQCTTP